MSKLFLGIELGSTRIKAVLIDENFIACAVGGHSWENRLTNGCWTYPLDEVWQGLRACFANLSDDYEAKFGCKLTDVSGIGISAMMHGYLPLDERGEALSEFRTWRNTNTEEAAHILRNKFNFNIPLRWSVAHLYQAALNKEEHVASVSHLTTLAGYVHFKLTGEKVLGVGDASGMFPIDSSGTAYNDGMISIFNDMVGGMGFEWKLQDVLPRIALAGENAGKLTHEGAKLLDPAGNLKPGAPFCPPEGDAGTGMVATCSTRARTGNVSAGTSIFAMLVLEKGLSDLYPEIDMVTTPDGKHVAMVHTNNGSTDLDAWVRLFMEATTKISPGAEADRSAAFNGLLKAALDGAPDCGGLGAVSYVSGEHNTGFEAGRPLFVRLPDADFSVANFMRTLIYSSMGTLRLGMDTLTEKEGVKIEKLYGHGGFFTVEGVAQRLMAGALNTPVAVMETAGEGGAWGIAILAAFLMADTDSLDEFLDNVVFRNKTGSVMIPVKEDVAGFNKYMERFVSALKIERAAVDHFV